jgi:large-conductance mechanosensitive channel
MAVDNQVLVFAVAIYAGTLLSQFFTALTRDIVLPLLSPLASVEGGVSKLVIPLGTIKLNIGDVIVQTVNLLIAFMVISMVLPYLKEYVPVAGKR